MFPTYIFYGEWWSGGGERKERFKVNFSYIHHCVVRASKLTASVFDYFEG